MIAMRTYLRNALGLSYRLSRTQLGTLVMQSHDTSLYLHGLTLAYLPVLQAIALDVAQCYLSRQQQAYNLWGRVTRNVMHPKAWVCQGQFLISFAG